MVVVDDRSDDGTGDVARQAAEGDARLRVVEGVEPPPRMGWKTMGLFSSRQGKQRSVVNFRGCRCTSPPKGNTGHR